jgi:hypothetical protein
MSFLPNNVLLDIFDFCRNNHDPDDHFHSVWEWHKLVHVCRAWRQTIFDSPLRLDLQIPCTFGTPVKYLGIWPNFPIAVDYCRRFPEFSRKYDDENIIFALEHPDRVAHIGLYVTNSHMRKLLITVIQKPFPVLRRLIIFLVERDPLLLPADFLGGSAMRLQKIHLAGVAFPTLSTFLLSASDLVELKLSQVPQVTYISPEAMTACLAKLPMLKTLLLEFRPSTFHPDKMPLSSITRTILPALTHFQFKDASKYLENLTARIICPRLESVNVEYWDDLADLQVVQLSTFFDLSLGPGIFTLAKARFDIRGVSFDLYPFMVGTSENWRPVKTVLSCQGIHWEGSRVIAALNTFSVLLSNAVHFRLMANSSFSLGYVEHLEWLHLFLQFSTVRALYISRQIAEPIASVLKYCSGKVVAKALPSLDLICLEDQPTSYIEKFIAVRKLSGRSVTAVSTEEEFDQILDSYNKN